MMRQYLAIKAQHPNAIVFYRMGDFYEMFLADAELAAPLLDIALTTRDKGKPDAVPMCGVPVHAADGYIQQLTERGYRVAVCEQVEDPKTAVGRGPVRRAVVEVITPGLAGDVCSVDGAREVAVAALEWKSVRGAWGLAALDVSTGDFRATQIAGGETEAGPPRALCEELARIAPRELLVLAELPETARRQIKTLLPEVALSSVAGASFEPEQAPAEPDGFERKATDAAARAAAALLSFLVAHQPFALPHIARLRRYPLSESMVLDAATRAHLELFENAEDRGRRGTLFERIDAAVTPLGSRRLMRWLAYPLLDLKLLHARQAAVVFLAENDRLRARLRAALRGVRDLERLLSRAARPGATPRDVAQLRASLQALPGVAEAMNDTDGEGRPELAAAPPSLPVPPAVPEVSELLAAALIDDPPVIPRGSRGANETGYIREGFHAELDGVRKNACKGREWITGLEARERSATGIPSLKVRFHPVHGYALEITKANLERVPGHYERKQTLANAERFTTPELREAETQVLGARERAALLEREIFERVRQSALECAPAIRRSAEAVAHVDALAALAEVARRDGWVQPTVDDSECLEIRGGRHPVIEPLVALQGGDGFVPNDTDLAPERTPILVLTGPNMSGKSTYLRQVALIVLLAQMGSFVPAESARVGLVDRVFTRVGAADRLARGDSTFMVEMRETADILHQASHRSLVILDEIGRGTSTYDGLSIAWAVIEYLHDTPGLRPRTLFATHYHEIVELARTRAGIENAHFEAREWHDEVIFLRRLVPGGASRSYGIQVARLAGLPAAVVRRAQAILTQLEGKELAQGAPLPPPAAQGSTADVQLGLFAGRALGAAETRALSALRACDPERMTPIEALLELKRIAESLKEKA